MDNNYKWFSDDYERNHKNEYFGKQRRNKKNGPRFAAYIVLVLITSLVTGFTVGGIMHKRFSEELDRVESLAFNTAESFASFKSDTTGKYVPLGNNIIENAANNNESYSITNIAKKVGPAIVGIRMTTENPVRSFFGNTVQQSQAEGSGIIIDSRGHIMTNYHVVSYADPKLSSKTRLEVFLPDGRHAEGKFVGGDSSNDLAVIKIELPDLPLAQLGDSSTLEVGQLAVAIGNPLGLEFAGSVTAGVISALNRKVETDDITLTLIQTDAAINPGNSGGALVNSKGQVIGINTIKIALSGVEGLGFAIPINDARPIIDQLILYGYVKGRAAIGISGQQITSLISRWYNIPEGFLIEHVSRNGAAQNAGIKQGDILISLAGQEVKTMSDLDRIKKTHKPGDTVNAVIVRSNRKINLKLTFTEDRG